MPRSAIKLAFRRQLVPEMLMRLVMALYEDERSSASAAEGTSAPFKTTVEVHQGSTLSPRLINLVLDEATNEYPREVLWDLFYAESFVLSAETNEEELERFNRLKSAMESKGLRVNLRRRRFWSQKIDVTSIEYPCVICGRGVRVNPIMCTECRKLIDQRCSGLQSVTLARDYDYAHVVDRVTPTL